MVHEAMDYWENSVYLSKNSELNKNIKESFVESKEISKIIYNIDLGRKENKRIIIGVINSEIYINIEKNTTNEKVTISYLVENLIEPEFV